MAAVRKVNIKDDIEAISQIPVVPSILEVICHTTRMGFAAIARVTENKWVACAVRDEIGFGLKPGGELVVETTICHEIRQNQTAVIISHVAEDEQYAYHHTPAQYGFESYISVPIILKDKTFFGTLCCLDPKPAKLDTPEVREMFNLFSDLIAFHVEAMDKIKRTEASLIEERKLSEFREQFIAILGHDLRTPIGAVLNSAQLLLRSSLNQKNTHLAQIIQDSSYRMKELIENIMDFARGRMGSGIKLTRTVEGLLENVLNQVINELRAIWPHRIIHTQFAITEPINCDSRRIAQLFSNLLSNALTHGKKETPIRVKAISENGQFNLSVINSGNRIPEHVIDRLFQPFSRGDEKQGKQGLGLGLYIASEIARAHGGELTVNSINDEICFTFNLPLVENEVVVGQ